MDILKAVFDYFTANWGAVESLARNLAADLAVLWVLGVGLAKVLKPFFPGFGGNLETKLFHPFEAK